MNFFTTSNPSACLAELCMKKLLQPPSLVHTQDRWYNVMENLSVVDEFMLDSVFMLQVVPSIFHLCLMHTTTNWA